MAEQHLNIVAFNIPYPPDYGGVIDVFYKIKALHAAGIKIHLHCFSYGRTATSELEKYCESVTVYKRKSMLLGFLSNKPFIVSSRSSKLLKENMLKNNYPVLFEGLHCCYYLDDHSFAERKKIVRMHNDEASYYLHLAKHEKKFLRKLYFYEEYKRLFRYENVLHAAELIACIARYEAEKFSKKFQHVRYVGPFHGNEQVKSLPGSGSYALYHGNLSVSENKEAVLFLINEVFAKLDIHFIIAGNAPAPEIASAVKHYRHIELRSKLNEKELAEIIQQAHLHVLPAFQQTGIKLKLLNALFNGRFCLVNSMMVENTGLEKYCLLADSAADMQSQITKLFHQQFTQDDVLFRKQIELEFSDTAGVAQLKTLL